MAVPNLGRDDGVLRDRRGATRVPVKFPVAVRDATHVWRGEALNLSNSGVLLKVPNRLPVGKQPPAGAFKPEKLPAVSAREASGEADLGHGAPSGWSSTPKAVEAFEKAVNLFEGLLAMNPKLAVEVKRRPTQLSKELGAYSIVPDSEVQPRGPRRRRCWPTS